MYEIERKARFNKEIGSTTYTDDAERVYHSSAFRRLAGVTQVVSAAEGDVYHNRLTHSIKVGRIARLIAEKLLNQTKNDPAFERAIKKLGGLDVSVVEAASIAHDIGHPPFGHCGEQELNRLVLKYGWGIESENEEILSDITANGIDGFEGNAQSFRVVTKIAPRHSSWPGLNLTRATLNALLKYPWLRNGSSERQRHKYGIYYTEQNIFEWARRASDLETNQRTLEAEIMDWADDVAYATHDFEDFYRAGLIDFSRLFAYSMLDEGERARYEDDFIKYIKSLRSNRVGKNPEQTLLSLVDLMPFQNPYNGTLERQQLVREVFSVMIERNIKYFEIVDGKIHLPLRDEVEILKQFTIYYVINSRAMQTQQHGQRKLLEFIFEAYFEASKQVRRDTIKSSILPPDFYDMLENEINENQSHFPDELLRARIVADVISRMTDDDALRMYQRLSGNIPGSIFDRIS